MWSNKLLAILICSPIVPKISLDISTTGIALVGENYVLTCTLHGIESFYIPPAINIAWRNPDGDVLITGSSTPLYLFMDPLQLSDEGMYICEVTVRSEYMEGHKLHDAVQKNVTVQGRHIQYTGIFSSNDVVETVL